MPFNLSLPTDNRRQMVLPEHREIEDSKYSVQTGSTHKSTFPSEIEPTLTSKRGGGGTNEVKSRQKGRAEREG